MKIVLPFATVFAAVVYGLMSFLQWLDAVIPQEPKTILILFLWGIMLSGFALMVASHAEEKK